MRYGLRMTAMPIELTPSRKIAAEIRAEMARRGITSRKLAVMLGGVSYMWVTRRIGLNADAELTFEDVDRIASALGVSAGKIITDAHWLPRLDSNQQPFGYRPSKQRRPRRRHGDLTTRNGHVLELVAGAA